MANQCKIYTAEKMKFDASELLTTHSTTLIDNPTKSETKTEAQRWPSFSSQTGDL